MRAGARGRDRPPDQLRRTHDGGARRPGCEPTAPALAFGAVLTTDLEPAADPFEALLQGDSGAGDPGDGDSGDGWDGWEGRFDDEEDVPYRRPRVVRVMALVTALAVVVGSIGTWVAILAVGPSTPSFAVSSVRTSVPSSEVGRPTASPTATVSFVVTNESTGSARTACRTTLSNAGGVVGAASSRPLRLLGGASASASVCSFRRYRQSSRSGPRGP